MSKKTDDAILDLVKNIHQRMKGGHYDDEPSSRTKIELAEIKKDVGSIKNSSNRTEKIFEKFVDSADEKFVSKELFDSKVTSLKSEIKIYVGVGIFIVTLIINFIIDKFK